MKVNKYLSNLRNMALIKKKNLNEVERKAPKCGWLIGIGVLNKQH